MPHCNCVISDQFDGSTTREAGWRLDLDGTARRESHTCIILAPVCRLAAPPTRDDEALKRKREEIRQRLERGEKVVVDKSGSMQVPSSQNRDAIQVPPGKLAVPGHSDRPTDGSGSHLQKCEQDLHPQTEQYRRLSEFLRSDAALSGECGGGRQPTVEHESIQVPSGKLAASFYWYENDPDLYAAEVEQMRRSFTQFSLQREADGRLSWIGAIKPGLLPTQPSYMLQVVYEHNHPSGDTYGGSIKVYSIDPDLDELAQIHALPHLLTDSHGNRYLCTNSTDDFRRGNAHASAASSIAWAVKWFSVFEMWVNGDIPDFSGHVF